MSSYGEPRYVFPTLLTAVPTITTGGTMTTPPTDYNALAEEALAEATLKCDGLNGHKWALEKLARALLALDEELHEARPLAAQMRQITTRK